jgi:hypothetical protein
MHPEFAKKDAMQLENWERREGSGRCNCNQCSKKFTTRGTNLRRKSVRDSSKELQ